MQAHADATETTGDLTKGAIAQMSTDPAAITGDVTFLAENYDDLPRQDRPPVPLLEGQWVPWTDVEAIRSDLAGGNISAPEGLEPHLQPIVDEAAADGIDLKIVITEDEAPQYPQVRDLATELSLDHPESTIYVASPTYIGTYSDTVPRAQLEAAQDDAYREIDGVVAAAVFEAKISQPAPPWGAYAGGVLLAIVLLIAVFVYLIRRRAQRGA